LQRILEIVDESADADGLLNKLDADPLVRSILLLHDLHPESTETRVSHALRELQGRLNKRDALVEFISLEDGTLKLRLVNNGASCGTEAIVGDAMRDAAPELRSVEIETISPSRSGFVSIEHLGGASAATVAGVQE
jgi:hypothetical protein